MNLMGKMLGRIGCGGTAHFDAAKRDATPVELKVVLGEEVVLTIPIVGWEMRRDEHGTTSRVTFTAYEP
jgi:hypothetical protein